MTESAQTARVTTEMVIQAIKSLPDERFTSVEIAERMGLPAYPVRAAVSWLIARNAVEPCGTRRGYYLHEGRRKAYKISAYRLREVGEVDIATLNRIFGVGR